MSRLEGSLSGVPVFRWRGEEFGVESKKPLAMLCYLCLRRRSPREELAELLWGNGRLLNVRQALYQLRQLPGAEEWLEVGETVEVRAATDVGRFEEAVAHQEYGVALEAFEPQLLSGLEVPRAPAFKEWLELERSRLEALYLTALEERGAQLERQGAFREALEIVQRFLDIDPLREAGHRSAMRLHYLLGDSESALEQFRRCQKVLRAELHSEPLPTTIELAESIARGDPLSVAVAPSHLPPRLLRLLQALALAERRLEPAVLARVVDGEEFEVAEGIAELERRRLVEAGGDLPGDVAADARGTLSGAFARLLSSKLAEALEEAGREGDEAAIGNHWLAAYRPERAAPWLLGALRRKLSTGEDEEVPLLGYRVLWCGAAEQRYEAALLLEAFCERKGDGELQDVLLAEAGEIAWELQDDHLLTRLGLRRARRRLRLNEPGEALAIAWEALDSARRLADDTLLAQALNTVGVVYFHLGELQEAKAYFEENSRSPLDDERYRSLNNLGAIAGIRGDLASSYGYLEQALTLARERRNVDDVAACLNNLAATAERMAAYRLAVDRLREARDLAKRTGNPRHAAQHLLNLAQVYTKQGALGPGWNTALEALDEGDELVDARIQGQALEQLGQIARHAGLLDEARAHFADAEQRLAQLGDERKLALARCNLALTEYLRSECPHRTATAEVEKLREMGLGEFARWFWLELALAASDAHLAAEWIALAADGRENPHLQIGLDIARLRMSLLRGEETGEERGDAPQELEQLGSALDELEVVEAPMGHLYLWAAQRLDADAHYHLQRARRLVAEQGQGLPRRMRISLEEQPDRWRLALGF